ncbi:MAG TPA: hypothetical protein VGQ81_04725 [Acidobacteriota bacterium]|nr:hypothetical protein [Acidobacteriota bacterium]
MTNSSKIHNPQLEESAFRNQFNPQSEIRNPQSKRSAMGCRTIYPRACP